MSTHTPAYLPDHPPRCDSEALPASGLSSKSRRHTAKGDQPTDDHDSPWKDALEVYFEPAMVLLAPRLHAAVDWSVPAVFLDKELQAIAGKHKQGRRLADKLAQVRLLDGKAMRLLVHVEVQGRARGAAARQRLARRLYQYRYRIQERDMQRIHTGTGRSSWRQVARIPPQVYSLAVLTDGRNTESQLIYDDESLDQGTRFRFPVVNLGLWADRMDELECLALANPFAVFIMAQLEANRYPDKALRLGPKIGLARKLGQYGYGADEIHTLFGFVDWVLRLPAELEPEFEQAMSDLSQEEHMAYVSSIERWGIRKGLEQGLEQGLAAGLQRGRADLLLRQVERRFGPVPDKVTRRIRSATELQLQRWALNFVDATTLDDVFRV